MHPRRVLRANGKCGEDLQKLMEAGVEAGAVKALPTRLMFKTDQVGEAFSLMAAGTNHEGKLLLKIETKFQTLWNPARSHHLRPEQDVLPP